MKRWLLLAGVLAALLVVASQLLPAAPWGWGGPLWTLLAVATVAAGVHGMRVAPPTARALDRRALAKAGAVAGGALALYLVVPRLAIIASYRTDAAREEFIAAALVVVVGLLLLVFATDEGDVA